MRRLPLLFALLSASCGGLAAPMTPSEVFKAASPSVVTIHSVDATSEIMQGSGIVIRPGVVVSNCHVIKAATAITTGWSGQQFPTTLLHADPERDLCSLEVEGLPAPAVTMGSSKDLEIGDQVFAIGAPRGLSLTLSAGLLSSRRSDLLQISAPISPGSSGGGLFDGLGRLVGVTTMYLQESQQLNFAVPVEWIAEIPARAARLDRTPAATPAVEAARQELQEWDAFMAGYDPEYMDLRSELDDRVRVLRDELPPDQWLGAAKIAYDEIKRSHAISATATRWVRIGSTRSGGDIAIDRETISRNGRYADAWVRMDLSHGTTTYRFSFDCVDATFSVGSAVVELPDGPSMVDEVQPEWISVPPESATEIAMRGACARRPI